MDAGEFNEWLGNRVAVLDGAMGTMLQRHAMTKPVGSADRVNVDMLSLTSPAVVGSIHKAYVDAGADILTTNTFNSQSISQQLYGTDSLVGRMNITSAGIARQVADGERARRVLVAGSIGPTNRRAVDFVTMVRAYSGQMEALIEGGVDLLLVETAVDPFSLKAALEAARRFDIAVMVSVFPDTRLGRVACRARLKKFVDEVALCQNVVSMGVNCLFDPVAIGSLVDMIHELTLLPVSVHPNAGLPDTDGVYHVTPRQFARLLTPLIARRRVSIAGGCCGTTPAHIATLAATLS